MVRPHNSHNSLNNDDRSNNEPPLDQDSPFEVALFESFVDLANLKSRYKPILIRLQIQNVIDKKKPPDLHARV
jgi:hypothetical protein